MEQIKADFRAALQKIEQQLQAIVATSFDGCLLWPIGGIQSKIVEAKNGGLLFMDSQPFYTSKHGYKVCARIHFNGFGIGEGTHVSLFFIVMKGEYDLLLTWPFKHKVTMQLLDLGDDGRPVQYTFTPGPTSSSFKRPTCDMNIATGCPLFVSHAHLEKGGYIKEDTIFVRVEVDDSDMNQE